MKKIITLTAILALIPVAAGSSIQYKKVPVKAKIANEKPEKLVVRIEKHIEKHGKGNVNARQLAVALSKTKYPKVLAAMGHTESNFNPYAVSRKGAKGIFQLLDYPKGMSIHDYHSNAQEAQRVLEKKMNTRIAKGNVWKAVELYCGTGSEAKVYRKKVYRRWQMI